MTLKEILNQVLSQSAFLEQDSFAGADDVDTIQMVAFANVAADEIMDSFPWNYLRKSVEIPLVAGQLQYDLPDDFSQYISESMWKQSGARMVQLPTSERLWGFMKAGNALQSWTYYAKFIQGKLTFTSVNAGDVINFDYVSNSPIMGADGTPKPRFTQDTDVWMMNDQTLIRGTKAFWKIEKEMPSAIMDMKEFQKHIKRDIGVDTPSVVIRTGAGREGRYPYTPPVGNDYLW